MQQLISSTNATEFDSKVNQALEEGAKVVPGTLVISSSVGYNEYHKRTDINNIYAVVIELPARLPAPPSRD